MMQMMLREMMEKYTRWGWSLKYTRLVRWSMGSIKMRRDEINRRERGGNFRCTTCQIIYANENLCTLTLFSMHFRSYLMNWMKIKAERERMKNFFVVFCFSIWSSLPLFIRPTQRGERHQSVTCASHLVSHLLRRDRKWKYIHIPFIKRNVALITFSWTSISVKFVSPSISRVLVVNSLPKTWHQLPRRVDVLYVHKTWTLLGENNITWTPKNLVLEHDSRLPRVFCLLFLRTDFSKLSFLTCRRHDISTSDIHKKEKASHKFFFFIYEFKLEHWVRSSQNSGCVISLRSEKETRQ